MGLMAVPASPRRKNTFDTTTTLSQTSVASTQASQRRTACSSTDEDFVLEPKIAQRLVKAVHKLLKQDRKQLQTVPAGHPPQQQAQTTNRSQHRVPIWKDPNQSDSDWSLGTPIGAGGFGLVCHVAFRKQQQQSDQTNDDDDAGDTDSTSRQLPSSRHTANTEHRDDSSSSHALHNSSHHSNSTTTTTTITNDSLVVKTTLPHTPREKLVAAVHHLATECAILQQLQPPHAHIVQLRGQAASLQALATTHRLDSYFLILEYLPTTLADKIVAWKEALASLANTTTTSMTHKPVVPAQQQQQRHPRRHHRRGSSIGSSLRFFQRATDDDDDDDDDEDGNNNSGNVEQHDESSSTLMSSSSSSSLLSLLSGQSSFGTSKKQLKQQQSAALFAEQMDILTQVASALEYLHHEHHIVYRDLKPSNVGFDAHGTVKLFDFGLAVALPPPVRGTDEEAFLDGTFEHLQGQVGTTQYMAPEVLRNEPYNVKADVFSFSLMAWQVLKLEKPLAHMPGAVVYGDRPVIDAKKDKWPPTLVRILQRGWAQVTRDRPFMKEYRFVLEDVHRIAVEQVAAVQQGRK